MSKKISEMSDAEYLQHIKDRVSQGSITPDEMGQDIAVSGALGLADIVKTAADIGRLATGDKFDTPKAISEWVEKNSSEIAQKNYSPKALAQMAETEALIQDPNASGWDVAKHALLNPYSTALQGVRTGSSFVIPAGTAGVAMKGAKALGAGAKGLNIARVAGATGGNMALNSSDVFTDKQMEDRALSDRYAAAGGAALATALAGALTGGGAEATLAKSIFGGGKANPLNYLGVAKNVGKNLLTEGAQEYGESMGAGLSKEGVIHLQDGTPIDLRGLNNQAVYEGVLGALTGGAVGAMTSHGGGAPNIPQGPSVGNSGAGGAGPKSGAPLNPSNFFTDASKTLNLGEVATPQLPNFLTVNGSAPATQTAPEVQPAPAENVQTETAPQSVSVAEAPAVETAPAPEVEAPAQQYTSNSLDNLLSLQKAEQEAAANVEALKEQEKQLSESVEALTEKAEETQEKVQAKEDAAPVVPEAKNPEAAEAKQKYEELLNSLTEKEEESAPAKVTPEESPQVNAEVQPEETAPEEWRDSEVPLERKPENTFSNAEEKLKSVLDTLIENKLREEHAKAETAPEEARRVASKASTPPVAEEQATPVNESVNDESTAEELTRPQEETPEAETETAQNDGSILGGVEEAGIAQQLPGSNRTVRLQNRDRSSAASVNQMVQIAANPDYLRLSPGRDFGSGAPVVAYGSVEPSHLGKEDIAVAADGKRIKVQYAVVEAGDVLTSNDSNGNKIEAYASAGPERMRAIAGNGRTAGLQRSYQFGNAGKYREEMTKDYASFGVDPKVIESMKEPILVRVMSENDLTEDIGAVSNESVNLGRTTTEIARDDVNKVDFSRIRFDDEGNATFDSIREFISQLSPNDAANLTDSNGFPNKTARDRFMAAVFKKAYNNDQLVSLYSEAMDPENKNMLNSLASVAGKAIELEGAGDLDLRPFMVEAAEMIINAKRSGIPVSDFLAQGALGTSEEARIIADAMDAYRRSAKGMTAMLNHALDMAIDAVNQQQSMFGDIEVPTRETILNEIQRLADEKRSGKQRTEGAQGSLDLGDGGWAKPPQKNVQWEGAERNGGGLFSAQESRENAGQESAGLSFSETQEAGAGASVAEVENHLNNDSRLGKAFKKLKEGGRVEVVQNVEDLPSHDSVQKIEDEGSNIQGAYDTKTGKVYLVADNLTAESASGVLLHEVGVHMAADSSAATSGEMKQHAMRARVMINNGYKAGDATAKAVKERMRDAGYIASIDEDIKPSDAEEALAYTVEHVANNDSRGAFKRWLDSVLATVKTWLNNHGINAKLTPEQYVEIARGNAIALSNQKAKTLNRSEGQLKHSVLGNSLKKNLGENWGKVIQKDELGRAKFAWAEHALVGTTNVALDVLESIHPVFRTTYSLRHLSPEMRRMIRSYAAKCDAAVQQAGGVSQEMMKWAQGDREMISDYIEGTLKPGVNPPAHVVECASKMSDLMTKQAEELVRLGMLSADAAARWRGQYLPRFYKHRKLLEGESWFKNLFSNRNAARGMGGNSLKGRGCFKVVDAKAVKDMIDLGWEVRDARYQFDSKQQKLITIDNKGVPEGTAVTLWRDWTPEERAQMGEIRDAGYRFVMGWLQTQKDIALGRMFMSIASNPEYCSNFEQEGFSKVPDTEIEGTGGVKRYGAIAGKYVRDDVLAAVMPHGELEGAFMQGYKKILAYWKEGKTALNPVSHMNNVMGNIIMTHLAGINMWDAKSYWQVMRDIKNGAEWIDEGQRAGLFGGLFSREELAEMLPQEFREMMDSEQGAVAKGFDWVFSNVLNYGIRQPLRKAYEMEDRLFRVLIYKAAIDRGLTPEEAVDYTHRFIPAYDDLPGGARAIRNYAIPFFAWGYKTIPTILVSAARYPWRFAAPAVILQTFNMLSFALSAGDDDDDWITRFKKGQELAKAEEEILPEYMKGLGAFGNPKFLRAWTDDTTGLPVYWNISNFIPGGQLFDANNQMGGIGFPEMLQLNTPIASLYLAMFANVDPFMGGPITRETDTNGEKAVKRAGYLWRQMAPALAVGGYHFDRILNAMANATDTQIMGYTGIGRNGQAVTPMSAALNTVGIKVRDVDFEKEGQWRLSSLKKQDSDIVKEARVTIRLLNNGAITQSAADDKLDLIQDKRGVIRDRYKSMSDALGVVGKYSKQKPLGPDTDMD